MSLFLSLTLVAPALTHPDPALARPARPVAPTESGAPLGLVDWFRGRYFSARNRAKAQGKWTLVVFWTEGSPWCQRLVDDTFADPATADALDEILCLNVDLTRDASGALLDAGAGEYTSRFPVAILPSMFFVSPEGELEDLLTGYVPPVPFLVELDRILRRDRTLSGLRASVVADGADIAARLSLAQKLEDLGDLAARDEQLASVKQLDPQETSLPVRRRKMGLVREAMESRFDDDKGLYDTSPLEQFLEEERHTEILLEGWAYLIDFYPRVNRAREARTASERLWQHVPEAEIMSRGVEVARSFWQQREELDEHERRFALEVASQVARIAQETIEDPRELAAYLDALACCYYMSGKRAAALETIGRCIDLDPDEDAYAVRFEVFKLRK